MTPADNFDVICEYAGFHRPLPAPAPVPLPAPAPVPLPAAAAPMPILPHSQPPSPKGLTPPVSAPPSRRASASVPEPEQTLENFERELENVFDERHLLPILHRYWGSPQIGDYREGGVVFYVDIQKGGALTCAVEDVGPHTWGPAGVTTGVCSQELFAGWGNTRRLVALGAEYEAAQAASAYRGGGYSDWFLPSFKDLLEMYKQKQVIDAVALAHGGTVFKEQPNYEHPSHIGHFELSDCSNIYWSSSEGREVHIAFVSCFENGYSNTIHKSLALSVRPVRAFRF